MTNYLDWWAGRSDRIYHEKRVAVDCKSLGEGEWVDDMMMCDFARILQHQQDLLDKRVVIVEPLHAAMMCNGNEDMQAMGVFFLRNPKPNSEAPSAGVRKALSTRNRTIRSVECTEFCTHCPRFVEEFNLILFFQTKFLFF